ncbi:hypothetical protein TI05_16175 [Achromatium sp. WMS3]|nr:hypothetical protein TI05_16175 [Achromatium sp. WMS3]
MVADGNVKNYKDGMRCLKGGIHIVAPAVRGFSTLPAGERVGKRHIKDQNMVVAQRLVIFN